MARPNTLNASNGIILICHTSTKKNARSDIQTFKQCFYDVFLPFVRKHTSDKVILLMDNCGPHGADWRDVQEQVTIHSLSSNCTARRQPMEANTIAAWKMQYEQKVLPRILGYLERGRHSERTHLTGTLALKGSWKGTIFIWNMCATWFICRGRR